ncbi:hypothetical protein CCR75_004863 [Bremia lactucae]|uniref:Retrovirus-related Pol polyprotein from transposon TNT 1-94-like beta-barrel domain-containing protein n=1 Tax=Bremia lactucae TaxID=4779 RepID=A0A976NYE6_BRELC|nr:hypothetical protein CCR75_004863 [Bremia lactucae]
MQKDKCDVSEVAQTEQKRAEPKSVTDMNVQNPLWYLDSASNTHVSCGKSVFLNYEKLIRDKMRDISGFAYGFTTRPIGIGCVDLNSRVGDDDTFKTKMEDVVYVQRAKLNLS